MCEKRMISSLVPFYKDVGRIPRHRIRIVGGNLALRRTSCRTGSQANWGLAFEVLPLKSN